MKLDGKVALITGASNDIGEGVARMLAAKGVKVGVDARRTDKLQNLLKEIHWEGDKGRVIEMNVSNVSVQNGVKKLINEFGQIDMLVNNAGNMYVSDIDTFRIDEWEKMVDINIKGLLYVTCTVLPHLLKQNSGHIIDASSIVSRNNQWQIDRQHKGDANNKISFF